MKKFFVLMICLMIFTPYYVFGLENYDTNFYFTIDELEYIDYAYGNSDKTYKDFIDEIKAYNTDLYYYIAFTNQSAYYTSRPGSISIVITDTIPDYSNAVIRYNVGRYTGQLFYPQFNSTTYFKYKTINYANFDYDNDIADIKACLDDYNSCNWTRIMEGLNPQNQGLPKYTDYNNSDITYNITSAMTNLIMYSNYDLTLGSPTQAMIDDTATYLKTTYINDNLITDKILTYYDLYYPESPEPEPEPEPEDPENDSEFTSWIYWFSEPTDSTSVLNNIYTLLFLYCFTMIIFKVYYSIKPRK